MVLIVIILLMSLSIAYGEQQSIYCPENHGYITLGMTADQVTVICGKPTNIEKMTQSLTEKIPVQQIIYNHEGAKKSFYGVWAMPIGNASSPAIGPAFGNNGGGGVSLQVNVIDNNISTITIDNNSANSLSICGGYAVAIGDSVSKLYNACGTPSIVNLTYINKPIKSGAKPEIWSYQAQNYQSSLSLTFIDGKLQSIN